LTGRDPVFEAKVREELVGGMGLFEESVKRSVDLFLSALGLMLISPLLLLIAISIKLDSDGPVFYRGMRIGRYGKPFRIWKFRSMLVGLERLGGTTGKDDPRVTRIGKFLRRYKLDELPQLMNVLAGDMSLVGPRPELDEHTTAYEGEEKLILSVRPGITDYASVQFHNLNDLVGSEDPHRVFIEKFRPEKNRLRLAYVKQQSLREDMKILFKTLVCVILRR
jgi:lipopolysaccharide/colanic/teichoic acid biosynthesis glycosyltransferase